MTIEIQRKTRFNPSFPVEEDGIKTSIYDGKNWMFTLKENSDKKEDNSTALILKTGVITNGYINLDLSVTDTDRPLNKTYKADFKIYTDATDPFNTSTFTVKFVDTVTK